MSAFYIGLMSGTSADGIDAVVVDFSSPQPRLIGHHYEGYSSEIRRQIIALCHPGENEINRLGKLDRFLGKAFATAAQSLLKKHSLTPGHIAAIGSHGQTIRHHPTQHFTLQIGDPNMIAAETGITTVADFRRRDMAYGGQGAPLVPAFHAYVFAHPEANRAIVNIGGIANVTILSADGKIIGFDTGPGNTLLDAWIEKHLGKKYDADGSWAAEGKVSHELLNQLLMDPYFKLAPPKSTGREYFHLAWLEKLLPKGITPVDVQATLTEFTAQSILNAIAPYHVKEILMCGGGIHNALLLSRLNALGNIPVDSTLKYGIDPDWMEAMAFAWLAKQTLDKKPGNVMAVTGASAATLLGGVYFV